MFFIVSGKDHPKGLARRLEFRPQHRAHYEALGEDLILSGDCSWHEREFAKLQLHAPRTCYRQVDV